MNIPGLSNLGSLGKLLDPGAIVKDVVNGMLPKEHGGRRRRRRRGRRLADRQPHRRRRSSRWRRSKDLPQAAEGDAGRRRERLQHAPG